MLPSAETLYPYPSEKTFRSVLSAKEYTISSSAEGYTNVPFIGGFWPVSPRLSSLVHDIKKAKAMNIVNDICISVVFKNCYKHTQSDKPDKSTETRSFFKIGAYVPPLRLHIV